MSAHTPGPWHVSAIKGNRILGDETTAETPEKLHVSAANVMICTVYPSRRALYRRDARAIAELPAIIAALRGCVAALCNPANGHGFAPVPALEEARRLLELLDDERLCYHCRKAPALGCADLCDPCAALLQPIFEEEADAS